MAQVRLKDLTGCKKGYVSVEHEGVTCQLVGLDMEFYVGQCVEVTGQCEHERACYYCKDADYGKVYIHESCVAEWVG